MINKPNKIKYVAIIVSPNIVTEYSDMRQKEICRFRNTSKH